MKNAVVAALVAALVGSGSAVAASQINGHSIRPHSIPLNRLASTPARPPLRIDYSTGQEYVVQPGSTGFGLAPCPRGQMAVSGGFAVVAEVNANQIVGLTSEPMAADSGWAAGFQNTGTTPTTVIAYALCTPDAKAVRS